MSMSQPIRDALVDILKDIDGIGVVHAYERYTTRRGEFEQFFVRGKKLLGWYLRRPAFKQRPHSDSFNLVVTDWRIVGLCGLNDDQESEINFSALVDLVVAILQLNPTLSGTVEGIEGDGQAGPELLSFQPVRFGGTLCHRAEIQLTTQHIQPSQPDEEALGILKEILGAWSPDIGLPHEPDYELIVGGAGGS